jgi:sigma-B regulation protein RsbU (phosphoserine phosphatase)
MYTDGVTEALDREENFFTDARLADLLRAEEAARSKGIVETVLADVDRFAQGAEQADDITVLSLEFHGPKEGMDHILALSMRNQVSDMNGVQERFASFASQHALPESDAQRIGLMLEELLSNVISYAYTDDLEHTIEIKFELSANDLMITIEDDGIPFNPFTIAPPDTSLPLEDRPIGGVGIHLVRSVMDRFDYERRGKRNIVTLLKRTGAT